MTLIRQLSLFKITATKLQNVSISYFEKSHEHVLKVQLEQPFNKFTFMITKFPN